MLLRRDAESIYPHHPLLLWNVPYAARAAITQNTLMNSGKTGFDKLYLSVLLFSFPHKIVKSLQQTEDMHKCHYTT